MKAAKVLDLLSITRKTLNTYVKSGKIRAKRLNNGFLDYNESDVMKLSSKIVHDNRILITLDNNRFEYNYERDKILEIKKIVDSYQKS